MCGISTIVSPDLYSANTCNTVVVVDVLRATTAICTAFEAGIDEVVPLENLDEMEPYRKQGYLRAAERLGKKINGAECGNSPTEYMKMDLRGRRLAYSTTNGTVCIRRAAKARRLMVGGFCNMTALADRLTSQPDELTLLCSGWQGSVSLEDTIFAGALSERLVGTGLYEAVDDATLAAIELWHAANGNLYDYLQRASHVQRLQGIGADDDVRFALKLDTCHLVPTMVEGKLMVEKQ